jgi:hypothetical protein
MITYVEIENIEEILIERQEFLDGLENTNNDSNG